jgi:anti-sigma factor RsiW
MTSTDHERYEQDVGAYLLGALPPLEASVFERHLMGCEECQRELERLRPAAEALPRGVEAFEPPPGLKASLMATVEAEAAAARSPHAPASASAAPGTASRRGAWSGFGWLRGLRPQVAVGLASVALLGGVALGLGLSAAGDEDTDTVTATVDRERLPAGASARVESEGDSASLRVSGLPQAPGGKVYEVWVERDGRVEPAGALFSPARDGTGSAAIPGGVEGVDRVMVTREAAGGVDAPTEMPVIVADV